MSRKDDQILARAPHLQRDVRRLIEVSDEIRSRVRVQNSLIARLVGAGLTLRYVASLCSKSAQTVGRISRKEQES